MPAVGEGLRPPGCPPLHCLFACPSAGKLTPEAAADLKIGLVRLKATDRWVVYSAVKPLFDVGSWEKLVSTIHKMVLGGGG